MTETRWTPDIYRADAIPEGEFGSWKIERFKVEEDSIGRLHYALDGRDVPAGTYTRLVRRRTENGTGDVMPWDTLVMSDTPAEFNDHLSFWGAVRMAGGSVLIHGLGLGCAVRMALQAGAEHVTVVELDQDLIDHVGPHVDPDGDDRVLIIQGDAYAYRHPAGSRWSCVWHDIWDTLCVDNIPEMTKLHRKFGGRCNWQGSWSRQYLESYR